MPRIGLDEGIDKVAPFWSMSISTPVSFRAADENGGEVTRPFSQITDFLGRDPPSEDMSKRT
jgi:hypothetical protein